MASSYYFAIVGHHDNPLFEIEFTSSKEPKVKFHSIESIRLTSDLYLGFTYYTYDSRIILPLYSHIFTERRSSPFEPIHSARSTRSS